jgi:hypothetical protein
MTVAGSRIAKLLPHFDTCIESPLIYIFFSISIPVLRWLAVFRASPIESLASIFAATCGVRSLTHSSLRVGVAHIRRTSSLSVLWRQIFEIFHKLFGRSLPNRRWTKRLQPALAADTGEEQLPVCSRQLRHCVLNEFTLLPPKYLLCAYRQQILRIALHAEDGGVFTTQDHGGVRHRVLHLTLEIAGVKSRAVLRGISSKEP